MPQLRWAIVEELLGSANIVGPPVVVRQADPTIVALPFRSCLRRSGLILGSPFRCRQFERILFRALRFHFGGALSLCQSECVLSLGIGFVLGPGRVVAGEN